MPAETRSYVEKNLKAAGAANGTRSDGKTGAIDPRLDHQTAEAAARWWAKKNGFSEDKTEAYIDAAANHVQRERSKLAQAEQDANRLVLEWLNENKPGADDLTSLSQIPAALLEGIAPAMRAALVDRVEATRARARARSEESAIAQARDIQDRAVLSLYAMSDEELSRTDLRQYVGIVPASTLGPWIARQRKAAGGGQGVSPDRLASMIDTLGKDFGASRQKGASAAKRQLWTDVANYVEQQLAGRADSEISREDLRAVVLNGLAETQVAGTGWFGSNWDNDEVRRAQLPAGADIDLDSIPPDVVRKIRETFRQTGIREPSNSQIFDAYRRTVARGREP